MRVLILALALFLFHRTIVDGPVTVQHRPKKAVVVKHTDGQCIASAIYHEARGEPLEGQRAVFDVIMHRVRATRTSPCAVVKAPKQFSWYGFKPILPLDKSMQTLLRQVKNHPKAVGKEVKWFFSGAAPKWAAEMECHMIGMHTFCKEKPKEEIK